MKHSQQVKNNPLFSNSLFIFLTRFFPSLASTLVIILFSRGLGKNAYGSYQNFWINLNIFYPLACFGIHALIITYTPAQVLYLINKVRGRSYIAYIFWAIVVSTLFATFLYNSFAIPFIIPVLYLLVFATSILLESLLIVFRSFKILVATNFLYAVAFLCLHYGVLKAWISLDRLFDYLLILGMVKMLVYIVAVRKKTQRQAHTEVPMPAMSKIRSLWIHLGFYDVLQLLFTWIDKFIVSHVLPADVSAIYFNGSMNIPVLPLILSAVGSAVLMQLADKDTDSNAAHSIKLVNQSGRMLACIVFPLFFFLLFFRYELFNVFLSAKYIQSVPIFFLSIMVLPLRAYSFTTVLQNRHKGAIINIGAVLDIVLACVLMYPMYLWIGLPGVALSFTITTYLQAGFYLYYTAKTLNVKVWQLIPYSDWLIKLIVFAIVFIVFHYLCKAYFTEVISLILGTGLSVVIVLSSLLIEFRKLRTKHG